MARIESKDAIEEQIRDLMLAETNLNSLKVIVRGFFPALGQEWFPCAEILIGQWAEGSVTMGNRAACEYRGQIRFWVKQPDTLEVVARKADVESYLLVQNLIEETRYLFQRLPNRTLQQLKLLVDGVEYGAVTGFELPGGEYGIDTRDERINTLDNYGVIDFLCKTMEALPLT